MARKKWEFLCVTVIEHEDLERSLFGAGTLENEYFGIKHNKISYDYGNFQEVGNDGWELFQFKKGKKGFIEHPATHPIGTTCIDKFYFKREIED